MPTQPGAGPTSGGSQGLKALKKDLGACIDEFLREHKVTQKQLVDQKLITKNWVASLRDDGGGDVSEAQIKKIVKAVTGRKRNPSAERLLRRVRIFDRVAEAGSVTESAALLVLLTRDLDKPRATWDITADPPPVKPDSTVLIHGHACKRLVIDMLKWAAAPEGDNQTHEKGGAKEPAHHQKKVWILSDTADQLAGAGDELGIEFQQALHHLLGDGWEVVHFVRRQVEQQPETMALIVANLLVHMSAGNYNPRLLEDVHADDLVGTVLIEGIGAARFITATDAFFIPWDAKLHISQDFADKHNLDGDYRYWGRTETIGPLLKRVAENLYDDVSGDEYRLVVIHKERPSTNSDDDGPRLEAPDHQLEKFDEAFTAAETSGGKRILMKPAPSMSTLPPTISAQQFSDWHDAAGGNKDDYKGFEERRNLRWEALHAQGGKFQDIGTLDSYQRYLSAKGSIGGEAADLARVRLPLYTGALLDPEDLVTHFEAIIDLIENYGYELALPAEADEVLFLHDTTYWGAVTPLDTDEAATATRSQVFFFSFDEQHRTMAGEIQNQALADGLVELFRIVWDTLPKDATDQHKVVAQLRRMITDTREQTNDPGDDDSSS